MSNTKVCTKCNKRRPLSDFYYRKDNKKYRNTCVYCLNRRTRKKLFIDLNKKLQECSRCGKIKPFSKFHSCKGNKVKIVTICKECRYIQIKAYRKLNPEKWLEVSRKFELKIHKNF